MTGDHPNHMATLHTRKRHGTEYAFQLRCSRSRRYFNATSDYYDDTMLSCCAGSSSLPVVVVCRILRAWWIRVCSGSIRLRAERIQALIMHNGRPVERYNNGAQPLQLFKCSCLAIHGAHIPVNVFGQAHASEKFFLCFPATFTVVALRFGPPRTLLMSHLIQHLAAWPGPIPSH